MTAAGPRTLTRLAERDTLSRSAQGCPGKISLQ
jgi:hypothetical protein